MSTKRQDATLVGAGVAACAVCCAGPILGFLAAIGLGTAAGLALYGAVAVVVGAVVAALVVMRNRRRRRARECAAVPVAHAPVELTATRVTSSTS